MLHDAIYPLQEGRLPLAAIHASVTFQPCHFCTSNIDYESLFSGFCFPRYLLSCLLWWLDIYFFIFFLWTPIYLAQTQEEQRPRFEPWEEENQTSVCIRLTGTGFRPSFHLHLYFWFQTSKAWRQTPHLGRRHSDLSWTSVQPLTLVWVVVKLSWMHLLFIVGLEIKA